MKRQWKQHEKDELIGQKIKVCFKGITAWGYISGRKENFPVAYCPEFGVHFEISWDLAWRAVNEGIVINA